MNILFLDQYSALGGAQQCLLDLLPAIEERGWNARVAIPAGGPLVVLLRERGIQVHEIRSGPYRCGKKSVTDLLRFAADVPLQMATIAGLLDQQSTDLVYVNGPRLLIAATLAVRRRVPILFHAHHVIGQSSAARLEGLALRRSRATIAACCDAAADPLRKWSASGPVVTVPNGTLDRGFRERILKPGGEIRIGMVGRIAPEKGQLEFLQAAAKLREDFPHARFVICGAPLFGDRAYHEEVRRLAVGLPVELMEWQADVGEVMRGLDVLAMPSKEEGMPRVLLEAFSAGLPAVACPVGGIPEVIEDGVNGFIARGDLSEALRKVLESDPAALQAMSRNARRDWEQRYTVAIYRERLTNLMERFVPRATLETAVPPSYRSAPHR
jgi:glycosyltransferase involved in cell wall biosynthesis